VSADDGTGVSGRRRVLILGAAGRDFHNFNVVYRDNAGSEVVGFTATQISGIAGRRYPASLSGELYPGGLPIVAEEELEAFCDRERVAEVVFAYSDVTHEQVMHLASRAVAVGADFRVLGPERTMVRAGAPVIAVSAVRTGCGKSQVARWLGRRLRASGRRVAVIRHPMPYGVLERQRVQRFATAADLDEGDCTIEEREEYEPHVEAGNVVFAGVDYEAIVEAAADEADVIVWDGGNNDFPLVRPDLHIVLTDALRPGHADEYFPGEAVMRMADVVVVNKVDAASAEQIELATREARELNAEAPIVRARSPVTLSEPEVVRGQRVLVIDDGPTLTHGGMPYGAGYVAAVAAGAGEIIDPRPFAVGAIAEELARFPHLAQVLPALGYSDEQLAALEATIEATPCDVVVSGTPIDLERLIDISVPVVRARYEFAPDEGPSLSEYVDAFTASVGKS
jgi:predicted GTPase